MKTIDAKCFHCGMTTRFRHHEPLPIELHSLDWDSDIPIDESLSVPEFIEKYNDLAKENFVLRSRLKRR